MAAGPQVTVVVPTRDRPDALTRCLAALERQAVDDFEVVVVDDRSRHRDDAARGRWRGTTRASGRGGGTGSGGGAQPRRERCARRDRVFHRRRLPAGRGLARRARAAVRRRRRGRGRTDPPRRRHRRARASQLVTNHLVDESRDASGAIGFAPTSNIACRRAVHRAVPFDEMFPTAAGEDRAWCDRLRGRRAPDRVRRRRLGAPRTGLDPARPVAPARALRRRCLPVPECPTVGVAPTVGRLLRAPVPARVRRRHGDRGARDDDAGGHGRRPRGRGLPGAAPGVEAGARRRPRRR